MFMLDTMMIKVEKNVITGKQHYTEESVYTTVCLYIYRLARVYQNTLLRLAIIRIVS